MKRVLPYGFGRSQRRLEANVAYGIRTGDDEMPEVLTALYAASRERQ